LDLQCFCIKEGANLKKAKLIALLTLVSLTNPVIVKADDAGSIVSWGAIAFDSKELDANDFTAISAGWNYSLALKSDGSIAGWGLNSYGQATPPEGNDFIAIAAGHIQSLAIRKEPLPDELVGD
jgi:alpha-tubulin suppressor-like RCC1 family protein